jgi:hypothetical protein
MDRRSGKILLFLLCVTSIANASLLIAYLCRTMPEEGTHES